MIGLALKRREKIVRENAFEQKKKKPGLKFNPGVALIDLRTSGPWISTIELVEKFETANWSLRQGDEEVNKRIKHTGVKERLQSKNADRLQLEWNYRNMEAQPHDELFLKEDYIIFVFNKLSKPKKQPCHKLIWKRKRIYNLIQRCLNKGFLLKNTSSQLFIICCQEPIFLLHIFIDATTFSWAQIRGKIVLRQTK